MNYKKLHDSIISRAENRIYNKAIHQKHHIVPIHECAESTDIVYLTFKEHYIVHLLRWKFIKTIGNFKAYAFMRGLKNNETHKRICSEAGKIGGKVTKNSNLGIFSKSYDRSEQTNINWANGAYKNNDYSIISVLGGKTTKRNKLGIFDPANQHMRTDWAKLGADALVTSGNRSGIYAKEWRNANPEIATEILSKGGKAGGKITGKMFWWNNGTENKRAIHCPGDGWVRGMLMSEKKRKQVMTIAGKNKL